MVAVNTDRKPADVPPLAPQTEDECRRHAAARVRRQMRQELAQRYRDAAMAGTTGTVGKTGAADMAGKPASS